ncbi:hypothetical protein AB1Y20_008395 [Prymnesium parvum]|uniref:Uncharacterized protein n=1 Tax=Prymnesium parvum TaxID=97485 RepID=A0AB34IT40_PRYPA
MSLLRAPSSFASAPHLSVCLLLNTHCSYFLAPAAEQCLIFYAWFLPLAGCRLLRITHVVVDDGEILLSDFLHTLPLLEIVNALALPFSLHQPLAFPRSPLLAANYPLFRARRGRARPPRLPMGCAASTQGLPSLRGSAGSIPAAAQAGGAPADDPIGNRCTLAVVPSSMGDTRPLSLNPSASAQHAAAATIQAAHRLHLTAPSRPERVRSELRLKSMRALSRTGLYDDEAAALVRVMSTQEMVHTLARVGSDRRGRTVTPTPAGLSAPEAEALAVALTDVELQRTITRAGLSIVGVEGDRAGLEWRASIALQHPGPAPRSASSSAAENDAQAELEARVAELIANEAMWEQEAKYFAEMTSAPSFLPIQTAAEGEVEDEEAYDVGGGTAERGGRGVEEKEMQGEAVEEAEAEAALAAAVNEYISRAEAAEEQWEEQLLLFFNGDRRSAGWPPLEPFAEGEEVRGGEEHAREEATEKARGETRGEASGEASGEAGGAAREEALGREAVGGEAEGRSGGEEPERGAHGAQLRKAPSAFGIWDEPSTNAMEAPPHLSVSAATAGSAMAGRASYEIFYTALPPQAQELLQDLYGLGILSPADEISRQARYVRALANSYCSSERVSARASSSSSSPLPSANRKSSKKLMKGTVTTASGRVITSERVVRPGAESMAQRADAQKARRMRLERKRNSLT